MTNIVIEQALFLIGTVYHHKSTHGLFSIAVFNYQRVTHKKKDLSQVYIWTALYHILLVVPNSELGWFIPGLTTGLDGLW